MENGPFNAPPKDNGGQRVPTSVTLIMHKEKTVEKHRDHAFHVDDSRRYRKQRLASYRRTIDPTPRELTDLS